MIIQRIKKYPLIIVFALALLFQAGWSEELAQDLDVKIYTSPFELIGSHDRYDLPGDNPLNLVYFIECRNIGAHSAEDCTLEVLLPAAYLISSAAVGISNSNFSLVEQSGREYTYAAESLERGELTRMWIQASIDVEAIPYPDTTVRPPATSSCVTIQADAFLYNSIEYESYTDNTTICKSVTEDTLYVDLEVTKEATVRCDENIIEYNVLVRNIGDRIVENITVTDLLPANTDTTPAGFTDFTYIPIMNAVSWEIDQLLPGPPVAFRLVLEITSDERPIDFWNTVMVRSDSIESNYSNNTYTTFSTCREDTCYDLLVEGNITDNSGDGYAEPSETLYIEVSCANLGNMPVDDVVLFFQFRPFMPVTDDDINSWAIPRLEPGEQVTYNFYVPIDDECDPSIANIRAQVWAVTSDSMWEECDPADNETEITIPYTCMLECPPLENIPRIITPNDDGFNDALIFSAGFDAFTKIYDRRGVLVRTLEDGDIWNGTDDRGEPLQPGIYIWQMFCPSYKTDSPYYTGTIAIKR
ncbi:gliding motility-associated C-terminal domain-containing protein [bacterium]|nr:gliding motility-associated C-terminal domain-containing protein [bacterium]